MSLSLGPNRPCISMAPSYKMAISTSIAHLEQLRIEHMSMKQEVRDFIMNQLVESVNKKKLNTSNESEYHKHLREINSYLIEVFNKEIQLSACLDYINPLLYEILLTAYPRWVHGKQNTKKYHSFQQDQSVKKFIAFKMLIGDNHGI